MVKNWGLYRSNSEILNSFLFGQKTSAQFHIGGMTSHLMFFPQVKTGGRGRTDKTSNQFEGL